MARIKNNPVSLSAMARNIRHSPSSIMKMHYNPLEQFICWDDMWYAPGKLGLAEYRKLRRARKQRQRSARVYPGGDKQVANLFGY